jgi:hypothetical protein
MSGCRVCQKPLPYRRWTRCCEHWIWPPRKTQAEWLAEFWTTPPSPAPATSQKASSTASPPHEVWLEGLLEELRTPESERAFQRADLLHVLDKPAPAWMRGCLKPGD